MKRPFVLTALVLPIFVFALSSGIVGAETGLAPLRTVLQAWSTRIDEPSRRFVVLEQFGGEAVLDRETQLVWQIQPQDNPSSSSYMTNFFGAIRHCHRTLAGDRMGWRLPTAEELSSLLVKTATQNPVVFRGALPLGHPFIGITTDRFWSISAGDFQGDPGRYVVAPNQPEITTIALETNLNGIHPTWCVRGHGGGQSVRQP